MLTSTTVYQKVVPAPIFALVIELTQVPGISATAGNPLAALGGLGGAGGGPAAAPPRAAATVSDVDEDVSAAPAGPGGRVPTDEEIAAIIAAASGRAPGASAQAQSENEAEAEAEDGEVQEAADELADVMASMRRLLPRRPSSRTMRPRASRAAPAGKRSTRLKHWTAWSMDLGSQEGEGEGRMRSERLDKL